MGVRLQAVAVLACAAMAPCTSAPRRDTTGLGSGLGSGSGSGPNAAPETCLEVQENLIETGSSLDDGEYVLHVDGDAAKPWPAFCRGMRWEEPIEYLSTNDTTYSQLTDGAEVTVTRFRSLRIDPITLEIDPLDATFATTTNALTEFMPDGRADLPAGWAQHVGTSGRFGPAAEASVDLRGTGFALAGSVSAATFFCTSSDPPTGDTSGSGTTLNGDRARFVLTAINNSPGTSTKTVADCAHLGGPDRPGVQDFTHAAWPLEYVGP